METKKQIHVHGCGGDGTGVCYHTTDRVYSGGGLETGPADILEDLQILNVDGYRVVIIAGSDHDPEMPDILPVYKDFLRKQQLKFGFP